MKRFQLRFRKPLIQSVFVCSISLSIMHICFQSASCMGTGHQRTTTAKLQVSLCFTYSVCSSSLAMPSLARPAGFAGHDVVLNLGLGNF